MTNNVIKFNPKAKKESVTAVPTYEEIEDDFIDKYLEQFIVSSVLEFDTDRDILVEEDTDTSKMIAFLRETLVATLHRLQGKDHPIHILASETVEFNDNPN